MRIIPAIDIIDGQCVRLTRGDYNTKKVYGADPLEMAKEMEDCGIKYLHLVDLDGAKASKVVNAKVLSDICKHTDLIVDFGGGLKSLDDFKKAFDCGASQCTAGTIAAKKRVLFLEILEAFGGGRIILGADALDRKISTDGWKETTSLDVIDFIKDYQSLGVKNVICTDIHKDGMLQGPSIDLYEEILKASDVNLIASGGVTTIQDMERLKALGCEGAIIGKALYEGNLSIKELGQLC